MLYYMDCLEDAWNQLNSQFDLLSYTLSWKEAVREM